MGGVQRHRWRNQLGMFQLADAGLEASNLLLKYLCRTGARAIGVFAVCLPASTDTLATDRTPTIASLQVYDVSSNQIEGL